MNRVTTLYRVKRGLKRELTAFSYRELRSVTLAWEMKDGGHQATLRMFARDSR